MERTERARLRETPTRRVLLYPALILALGTLAGLALGRHELQRGLAFLGAALLVVRAANRMRPGFLMLFVLLSVGRGFLEVRGPLPEHASVSVRRIPSERGQALVGNWQALGARRGYLKPVGSTESAHPILYTCDAAPPDGALVVALAGGVLVPFPRSEHPGRLGKAGWLATSHLQPDEFLVLGNAKGTLPTASFGWIRRLRGCIRSRSQRLEGKSGQGLVQALLVGERDGLPAGRADLFTRTGTRHLLALSGLHVALFASLVLFPLTRLVGWLVAQRWPRCEDPLVAVVRAAALLFYATVAGGGPAVVRAALTTSLALFATWVPRSGPFFSRADRGSGRIPDGLSVWSCALLVEVLSDPVGLDGLSLQLSYLATLGILVGTRPLLACLWGRRARLSPDSELAPWPLRLGRIVAAKLGRIVAVGLAVSLAASFATLPLVWNVFGEIAPIGWLLSLPCGFLVAGITALGWAGVACPSALLEPLLASAIEVLSSGLVGLIQLADRLPATPLSLPVRPFPLLALGSAMWFYTCCGSPPWARRAAWLLWGMLLLPCAAAPSGFELVVLDVGHGTAVLVRAPGLPALVFDAGSRDRKRVFSEALRPQLAAWDVGRPDVLVTHGDHDHISALAQLALRYPPRRWFGPLPAAIRRDSPADLLHLSLDRGRMELSSLYGGTLRLDWVRGLEQAGNEGSSALELVFCGSAIVLFGDAEGPGLRATLELLEPGSRRLVLFPHHGSETALLGELLETLEPEEIWISAATPPSVAGELQRRREHWGWTGNGPLALRLHARTRAAGDADRQISAPDSSLNTYGRSN